MFEKNLRLKVQCLEASVLSNWKNFFFDDKRVYKNKNGNNTKDAEIKVKLVKFWENWQKLYEV